MKIYDSETPPFFSIIICTFNRSNYLPRAIESLTQQIEGDWEAIIVDDGSIDNSWEIVQNYALGSHKIRYMFHKNRGLARSRNVGIQAATGQFITFLDSDDLYEKEHLSTRKEIISQNPKIDLFHGGLRIIGSPYVPDKNDPSKSIRIDECVTGATFIMRREKWIDVGGFPDVPFSPESALYEKLVANSANILHIDLPTYVYDRTVDTSITNLIEQGGVNSLISYRKTNSRNSGEQNSHDSD